MLDLILAKLTEYWFISGGTVVLMNVVFYVVDKFNYKEKDFQDDCVLVKNQNLFKKSLLLKELIEKIKSSSDDEPQETEKNTYISFLNNFSRHNQYDLNIDNISKKFELFRNLLLILLIVVLILLFLGFILLEIRIYVSVFNFLAVLFAFILLFSIRNLESKLRKLRLNPDLLS